MSEFLFLSVTAIHSLAEDVKGQSNQEKLKSGVNHVGNLVTSLLEIQVAVEEGNQVGKEIGGAQK